MAVNGSHFKLGINDNLLQSTHPITEVGENVTVFETTYLGGIPRDEAFLKENSSWFIGCMEDIIVNDMRITEEDFRDDAVDRGVEGVS